MRLPSPAWVSVVLTVTGAALTLAVTKATVEASTDLRLTSLEQQLPAMEKRLNERIDRLSALTDEHKSELRTDIRELRGLILKEKE